MGHAMRSIERILSRSRAPEPEKPVAEEKRFAPRRKAQTAAMVHLAGGTGSFPCMIRDMSTTGARLGLREGWDNPFSSGVSLNDRVQLVVRLDRVMYECKIVRRAARELGVKFVAAPKPLPKIVAPPPAAGADAQAKREAIMKKLAGALE